MGESAATGTVYALIDPRDDVPRYIGQTKRPLSVRLGGHLTNSKSQPRVRGWIAELRAAGLRPLIVPLREGVLAADLLTAAAEEITRIISVGGTLLNEHSTALGRELDRLRREAEREAAERGGWAELASVALATLGGPLPPGELPGFDVPDVAWRFMSEVAPTLPPQERWRPKSREQEQATQALLWHMRGAWPGVRGLADDDFGKQMEYRFSAAIEIPFGSRADASRFLSLAVWYMVAVDPWRHLAEIAGLPRDDASFIAWAGQHPETRDALAFLAAREQGALETLARSWERDRWHDGGAGRLLATAVAAHTDTVPAAAIHRDILVLLEKIADDHQLTAPMARLMMSLDPKALDRTFGPDMAADLDRDLGLVAGTSGRVLRALIERLGHCNDPQVRRAADRSAQEFSVVALPDYHHWHGRIVIPARAVSASLTRAGIGEPDGITPEEYLAEVHALWIPGPVERRWQPPDLGAFLSHTPAA